MTRYQANPAFRIKRDGKAYFLRHQNGARIRTDRLINSIWEKADGRTFAEIKEELAVRSTVSDWMLQSILALMEAADLLSGQAGPAVVAAPVAGKAGPLVSVVIVNRDLVASIGAVRGDASPQQPEPEASPKERRPLSFYLKR